ncbi:hypothetical protein K435DRAFT_873280 [Dendrothele bispora CBS 962.96]|uniref:DUF659 domain-containing protein n=1 Tax=Dendrothele bispora (strain CBS 962.96) TaxID=1314807 RepID=A0A4S8KZK6_DENBC|nr:hypothetical protein K435DRAFT_873280 [Dendrothele bispora CBS 962.96]
MPGTLGNSTPSFITKHFTKQQKLDNKSQRSWYSCNYCSNNSSLLEHRDNKLAKHLKDHLLCPNAPRDAWLEALEFLEGKGITVAQGKKRKRDDGPLDSFIDRGLTSAEEAESERLLIRAFVSSNYSFRSIQDPYFLKYLHFLRPSYTPPTEFVLRTRILDAEAASVKIEEMRELQGRCNMTLLIDGWEDLLRRSIYGTVAAQDLTGKHGSADSVLETAVDAMDRMGVGEGKNFICATTDNPNTMISFRKKYEQKFPWMITLACFLHQLNTTIGEICMFPAIKKNITQSTRILTFFNGSHYWGGQLKEEAQRQGITRGLKKNCESRWYALIIHSLSVKQSHYPLQQICCRPDANEKTNGLSPVKPDVVSIILSQPNFWRLLDQLIHFTKPLVDAIGNLESRECNLADCMLETIRCARALAQLELEEGDDPEFLEHAKKFMISTALELAEKWEWSEPKAVRLVENIKDYQLCKGIFVGAHKDGLTFWQSFPVAADQVPLKQMAITLFLIVPHSADVEHLFSDLGGIQTPKRSNLNIETFESLGTIKCSLRRKHHSELRSQGKTVCRQHGHMHTKSSARIDADIITEKDSDAAPAITPSEEESMHWKVPFAMEDAENEQLDEDISDSFEKLAKDVAVDKQLDTELELYFDLADTDVLDGKLYSFKELEKVDRGIAPVGYEEEINVLQNSKGGKWSVKDIMRAAGV